MWANELDRQADVLGFGGHLSERESEGVGAVEVDDFDGIDAVAFGFAHALALAVEDEGIDGDVVEGDVLHVVEAGHHHAGDPEGDDVAGGDEDTRWIPFF